MTIYPEIPKNIGELEVIQKDVTKEDHRLSQLRVDHCSEEQTKSIESFYRKRVSHNLYEKLSEIIQCIDG